MRKERVAEVWKQNGLFQPHPTLAITHIYIFTRIFV